MGSYPLRSGRHCILLASWIIFKNNRQKSTSCLEVWNPYINRILSLNYYLHNAKMFSSDFPWKEDPQHPVLACKSIVLYFSFARTTGWSKDVFSHWVGLLVLAVIAKTPLWSYCLACCRNSKHHTNSNKKPPQTVDYFKCAMNLIILKYFLLLLKSMAMWIKKKTGCNYWVFISWTKGCCIIVESKANTYSRCIS